LALWDSATPVVPGLQDIEFLTHKDNTCVNNYIVYDPRAGQLQVYSSTDLVYLSILTSAHVYYIIPVVMFCLSIPGFTMQVVVGHVRISRAIGVCLI
jgi:hypothetical protein